MGWMDCMSCGCRVHTSKLPINICDDCEVIVNEVQNQSTPLPETKEDIDWIENKCDTCGITTHRLVGDNSTAGCINCAIEKGQTELVTEYNVQMDYGKMEEIREEGSEKYCLCDHLITDDVNTITTLIEECAALGCNICLSKQNNNDDIDWPKHYNTGKIQPIDVIEDWKLDFRLANSVKYIARAGKKDPEKTKQDLEKALWYIKRFIDKEC